MNKKKTLIIFCMLLTITIGAVAQDICFNPTMNAAKEAYNSGQYSEAKKLFKEARNCSDCPAKGKEQADSWIKKCDEKMHGSLSLSSSPSGATVTLDGTRVGTTPLTKGNLSPGNHTVRFSKQGHEDVTVTLYVSAGQTKSYSAALTQYGSLSLSSTPPGATVILDGAQIGTTPITKSDVPSGSHTVRFSKEGYEDTVISIKTIAGQNNTLEILIKIDTAYAFIKADDYFKKEDYTHAIYWYQKIAELGYAKAQNCLGLCHNKTGNHSQAVYWFRKAAEQKYAIAEFNLCECYQSGKGVQQNDDSAVYWNIKAAAHGNPAAQCFLGIRYTTGYCVKKNMKEAINWFSKAAEQGDISAQLNLGNIYYYGNAGHYEYEKAVYWFSKAADQGNAHAQYNLGICYENGYGVPKDINSAIEWYRKAAKQGYTNAQKKLKSLGYSWE